MDRDTRDPVIVVAATAGRHQAWQRRECRGGGAPLEERTAGRELHATTLQAGALLGFVPAARAETADFQAERVSTNQFRTGMLA